MLEGGRSNSAKRRLGSPLCYLPWEIVSPADGAASCAMWDANAVAFLLFMGIGYAATIHLDSVYRVYAVVTAGMRTPSPNGLAQSDMNLPLENHAESFQYYIRVCI